MKVGKVSSLWRFPVKSMLGERVDSSLVSTAGLVGDRAYAMLDAEDGKLVSAKNPRKWGAVFQCTARFDREPITDQPIPSATITLPDGRSVSTDASDIDAVLSDVMGRKVRLESSSPSAAIIEEYWPEDKGPNPYGRVTESSPDWTVTTYPAAGAAPAGTFFDVSAIHLITTSSITPLEAESPSSSFDVRRFRPNVVVDTMGAKDFIENEWTGAVVEIGDELALRGVIPTARCVMTTLEQEDLPKDPEVLRTLVRRNRLPIYGPKSPLPCAGMFMEVVRGGAIKEGDPVRLA